MLDSSATYKQALSVALCQMGARGAAPGNPETIDHGYEHRGVHNAKPSIAHFLLRRDAYDVHTHPLRVRNERLCQTISENDVRVHE
jgi:hypothetical protein